MRRDFAGTVAEIARIGYPAVELAGFGNLDAEGARAALANANLVVSGMHVGIAALRADLAKVIAEAKLLGTRHVTRPPLGRPPNFPPSPTVEKIAAELDAFGAQLLSADLQLSFHNHAAEFQLLEGRPVFDWLLAASQPRHLAAEVDVYWVQIGGYSPEKFLRDHGARVKLVHLKDETELGLGPVDFPRVFATVESIGAAEWYVVEQEKYNHTPLESVRLCLEQLKRWGKT